MAVADVLLVVGLLALVVYGSISLLIRGTGTAAPTRHASGEGRWRAAHYDERGHTRVVLQKVSADGRTVLDEHSVARIATEDPDYDDSFMSAMLAARQRQALFEAEEG